MLTIHYKNESNLFANGEWQVLEQNIDQVRKNYGSFIAFIHTHTYLARNRIDRVKEYQRLIGELRFISMNKCFDSTIIVLKILDAGC